jgi:hypothetical protein
VEIEELVGKRLGCGLRLICNESYPTSNLLPTVLCSAPLRVRSRDETMSSSVLVKEQSLILGVGILLALLVGGFVTYEVIANFKALRKANEGLGDVIDVGGDVAEGFGDFVKADYNFLNKWAPPLAIYHAIKGDWKDLPNY